MYGMLILRTSYQISVLGTIKSPIHSCEGLNLHLSAIPILFYLIFMMNHIPWTLKILVLHAKFHNGALIVSLAKMSIMISLLALLWEKLEVLHKLPSGAFIFLPYIIFALFIGRCINGKHDHSHLSASDLSVLKCAVLGDK